MYYHITLKAIQIDSIMRIFRVFKKNIEIDLQIMARPIFDRKIDHDDWWFSQNRTEGMSSIRKLMVD
jgi:hypothetical protein